LVDSPSDDLRVFDVLKNPINIIAIFMITVITQLMLNPKKDQYGADHSNG
jgi:hypothetical protein